MPRATPLLSLLPLLLLAAARAADVFVIADSANQTLAIADAVNETIAEATDLVLANDNDTISDPDNDHEPIVRKKRTFGDIVFRGLADVLGYKVARKPPQVVFPPPLAPVPGIDAPLQAAVPHLQTPLQTIPLAVVPLVAAAPVPVAAAPPCGRAAGPQLCTAQAQPPPPPPKPAQPPCPKPRAVPRPQPKPQPPPCGSGRANPTTAAPCAPAAPAAPPSKADTNLETISSNFRLDFNFNRGPATAAPAASEAAEEQPAQEQEQVAPDPPVPIRPQAAKLPPEPPRNPRVYLDAFVVRNGVPKKVQTIDIQHVSQHQADNDYLVYDDVEEPQQDQPDDDTADDDYDYVHEARKRIKAMSEIGTAVDRFWMQNKNKKKKIPTYDYRSVHFGDRDLANQFRDQNIAVPKQSRDENYRSPKQFRGQNNEAPKQSRDQNYENPTQFRDQKYETPNQAQDQNYDSPMQYHGENYEPPNQSHDQNYDSPMQFHGENYETPNQFHDQSYEMHQSLQKQGLVPIVPNTQYQSFPKPDEEEGEITTTTQDPRRRLKPRILPPTEKNPNQIDTVTVRVPPIYKEKRPKKLHRKEPEQPDHSEESEDMSYLEYTYRGPIREQEHGPDADSENSEPIHQTEKPKRKRRRKNKRKTRSIHSQHYTAGDFDYYGKKIPISKEEEYFRGLTIPPPTRDADLARLEKAQDGDGHFLDDHERLRDDPERIKNKRKSRGKKESDDKELADESERSDESERASESERSGESERSQDTERSGEKERADEKERTDRLSPNARVRETGYKNNYVHAHNVQVDDEQPYVRTVKRKKVAQKA